MELILGLPPLTQFDAGSNPMSECFVETPDFTPYVAVANNIPLNQMNPDKKAITDPVRKYYAELSDRLPLKKVDQCDEDVLNRILWFAQKGTAAPYPKWAILPRSMRPDRD